MSRERALKIKAHLVDVAQRQILATPSGMALNDRMPIELRQFIDHVVGNAAMVVDMAIDAGELVEFEPRQGRRPILFAMVVEPEVRHRVRDGREIVQVELPPNCSVVVDVDLAGSDVAPPFISIRRQPDGLTVEEVNRG